MGLSGLPTLPGPPTSPLAGCTVTALGIAARGPLGSGMSDACGSAATKSTHCVTAKPRMTTHRTMIYPWLTEAGALAHKRDPIAIAMQQ